MVNQLYKALQSFTDSDRILCIMVIVDTPGKFATSPLLLHHYTKTEDCGIIR